MWPDWDFNMDGEIDDMDTCSYMANVLEPLEGEEQAYDNWDYDDEDNDDWW